MAKQISAAIHAVGATPAAAACAYSSIEQDTGFNKKIGAGEQRRTLDAHEMIAMWTQPAEPMNQLDHNSAHNAVIATNGMTASQQVTTGAGLVQKVDTPELDPVPRPTGD